MLDYSKKYTIFTFNLEGNKFKVPREKTMNIAKCVAFRPCQQQNVSLRIEVLFGIPG